MALEDYDKEESAFIFYSRREGEELRGVLILASAAKRYVSSGNSISHLFPENEASVLVDTAALCPNYVVMVALTCFSVGHTAIYVPCKQSQLWLELASEYFVAYAITTSDSLEKKTKEWHDTFNKKLPLSFDLTYLRAIEVSNEFVFADTIRNFENCFLPWGLRANIVRPVFTLSDAPVVTLSNSIIGVDDIVTSSSTSLYPGLVGYPISSSSGSVDVRIVDPITHHELAFGDYGEIWIHFEVDPVRFLNSPTMFTTSSRSPLSSYRNPVPRWVNSMSTYIRTGIEGFIEGNYLFLCGRIENVILIGNKRIYAERFELLIERSFPQILSGSSLIVSSLCSSLLGIDFYAEISPCQRLDHDAMEELADKILQLISMRTPLSVITLCFVSWKGHLPARQWKFAIELVRSDARPIFNRHGVSTVFKRKNTSLLAYFTRARLVDTLDFRELNLVPWNMSYDHMLTSIASILSYVTHVSIEDIMTGDIINFMSINIREIGIDSLHATVFAELLSKHFSVDIMPHAVLQMPHVKDLVDFIIVKADPTGCWNARTPMLSILPEEACNKENVVLTSSSIILAVISQVLCVLFILFVFACCGQLSFSILFYALSFKSALIQFISFMAALLLFVVLTIFGGIVLKWLLLGKMQPGVHKVYSFFYWRWWIVHTYIGLEFDIFGMLLQDSCVIVPLYRLLGAKIGKNCSIDGLALSICWDLISIGDNTEISGSTLIRPSYVTNGTLFLNKIEIGDNCKLKDYCIVLGNTNLPISTVRPIYSATVNGIDTDDSSSAKLHVEDCLKKIKIDSLIMLGCWVAMLVFPLVVSGVISLGLYIALITSSNQLGPFSVASWFFLSLVFDALVQVLITVVFKRCFVATPRGTVISSVGLAIRRKLVHRMMSQIHPLINGYLSAELYYVLGAQVEGILSPLNDSIFPDPDSVIIENGVLIGAGACFQTEGTEGEYDVVKGLTLRENCLVGTKTYVKGGVEIGSHAKVLTYAVVEADTTLSFGEVQSKSSAVVPEVITYHFENHSLHGLFQLLGLAITLIWIWTCIYVAISSIMLFEFSMLLIAVVVFSLLLTQVAIIKWLVQGKLTTRKISGRWDLLRYSVVSYNNALMDIPIQLLQGGPLINLYYNLMGANISLSATLYSTFLYDLDLVNIGPGACVDVNATISPHIINGTTSIRLKEIFIGADCYIGPNAYLVGGVSVRDSVAIGPHSTPVDKKQYSTDGVLWCGAPASHPIPWTNHHLTTYRWREMIIEEENNVGTRFTHGGYKTFFRANDGYTALHTDEQN